jgi:periplasmic protein TonB
MATPIKSRVSSDQFGGGVAGSFLLHAILGGLLVSWAWFSHTGKTWGDSSATAGAIQASMVSALPLPPKAQPNPDNVLATETPSPAPAPPAPKTVEAPRPDAIPIPAITPKTAKIADKTTPAPPLHPQPAKVQPNKAQTGEAAASVPLSTTQTKLGTFSVGINDATFGTRFGYYNEQIKRKLESEWYAVLLDQHAVGHRVYITFRVQRDGTPTDIDIGQPSGDRTLDQTALDAVRHVDTFGPLPEAYQGSYVNVTYYFDPPSRQ